MRRLRWRGLRQLGWGLASCLAIAGCGSGDSSPDASTTTPCVPGESTACVGAGGCHGGQICAPDGEDFGPCKCDEHLDSGTDDAKADGKAHDSGHGHDGAVPDAPTDDVTESTSDSGKDSTGPDAPTDTTSEAASDSGHDGTLSDAPPDTATDSASESSMDTGTEAAPEASVDSAADSGDAGPSGSNVTCTFTSVNETSNAACSACMFPQPETVTETNVPIYLDQPCLIASSATGAFFTPSTFGLVVVAPEIWSDWGWGGNSFCLGTSSTYPGELVGQPMEAVQDGSFTGFISVTGTAATVSLSGNYFPDVVQYLCGSAAFHETCVLQSVSCTGTGTALPSTCLTNNGGCDPNATCAWTGPTSNSCTCNAGYTGDGTTCTPLPNPCLTDGGGCSVNATCMDENGVAQCTCNAGYTGNGINCVAEP
jgi:hypothetical protein